MFAMKRLLERAGLTSWQRKPRSRFTPATRRPIPLRLEALESRIVPTLLGQQIFPLDHPLNQNIANAPVAANSAAVIANIGVGINLHADWGEASAANGNDPLYGIPVNIVHGNTAATVNVIIDNYPDESDLIPVPMPSNPVIEGDFQNGANNAGPGPGAGRRGDSHLIVWDVDNNIAYELFGVTRPADPVLFPNTDGDVLTHSDGLWHAAGQTVWDMKTNTFRTLGFTSADAAGLSILAGLVRPDEGLPVAQGGQGAINHAIRFTLPSSKIMGRYTYPASHQVGGAIASNKLPMGARLRLRDDATVNNLIAGMGPQAQIVATAMQQYGLILADIGSSMYITGSSATHNASNQIQFVWDMDDVLDIQALEAGMFDVVDLTPVVTGLSQSTGTGGNTITIIGQNFSGAAGHLSVFFGSTAATNVTFIDDSHITAVVPAGTTGNTVQVTVQSGFNAPGNPQNLNDPIFGYGVSTTSASFTYGITTTTTVSNTSTDFSNAAQSVTLTANVATFGVPMDIGTVTFTVFNGATQIGSAVTSGTVTGGVATASYTLPGNTASGAYTIQAVYTPGGSTFAGSSDNTHTLTVVTNGQFATTTSAVSTSTSGTSVTLSATVLSGGLGVNEGTVTFTLRDAGNNVIGTPVTSATVSNGNASVTYAVPVSAAGVYTIEATYNPGPDHTGSSDTSHTLTVSRPPVFTSAATTTFTTTGGNNFVISVSGFPTASLTHSTGMPAGVVFTNNGNGTATLSGTPTASPGAYFFNVTASNTQGSATQGFTLVVAEPPPSGTFADNFTTPGSLSNSWSVKAGSFAINGSQQAVPGSTGANVAVLGGIRTDVSQSVTVSNLASGAIAGLIARYQGPGDRGMYLAAIRRSAGTYTAQILRNLNGTWAVLATTTLTGFSGTGVLRFDVVGSSLRLFVDGTLKLRVSDRTFTAGAIGLRSAGNSPRFAAYSTAAITPVQLPFSENFAAATPGGLSSSWFNQFGSLSISGGTVGSSNAGAHVAVLNADPTTDVSVTATVAVIPVNGFAALVARYQGAGDRNYYMAVVRRTTTGFRAEIWRNLNGVVAQLANVAIPANPPLASGPFTIRFDAVGSSLKLFVNDIQRAAATDGTLAAGVTGIRLLPNVRLSDFSTSSLRPDATQPAVLPFTDSLSTGVSLGATWGVKVGSYTITGGQAAAGTATVNLAALNALTSNTTESVTVTNLLTGQFAGLIARYSGVADAGMYVARVHNTGTQRLAQILRNVNGTWTTLASLNATGFAVGNVSNTLRFDAIGSSLRLYINGGLVASVNDATFAVGQVGLRSSAGVRYSNFNAAVLAAAGSPFIADFTTAANGPLSASWFNQLGSVSVSSGAAAGANAGNNIAVLNANPINDVSVSATLTALPPGLSGLVARYQGVGDRNMYLGAIRRNGTTHTAEIWKNLNGTWTRLALASIANPGGSFDLRFDALGSSLRLFVNGNQVTQATDATFASGISGVRIVQNVRLSTFGTTAL